MTTGAIDQFGGDEAVTIDESILERYQRFSLYNSPYPAHGDGCAIDLYPGTSDPASGLAIRAPSPVAGEVRDTWTVRAPPKPYASEFDNLLLIDVEEPASAAGLVARILHVDPAVDPGDRVAIGDDLGELVRAGFFAPWVGTHIHLGFRRPDQHLHRATGSLPVDVDVDLEAVPWNGDGTVVTTGDTYAVLDAPTHPSPGEAWIGVASDCGGVVDGGLPHYETGGVLQSDEAHTYRVGAHYERRPVFLNGDELGGATGRTIDWQESTVFANGEEIRGLSFSIARDENFGVKLICPDRSFDVGERVSVSVERP